MRSVSMVMFLWLNALKYCDQVRWENWTRPNGTKTTWEHLSGDSNIDSSFWDSHREEELNSIALADLEMTFQGSTDFHNTATYERNQALTQKLARVSKLLRNQVEEADVLMEHHARLDRLEAGNNRHAVAETFPSPARSSKRLSSRQLSVTSSSSTRTLRSPSNKPTRISTHIARSPSPDSDEEDLDTGICQLR